MRNAIFIWIPKTGGLSIFDALKKHGGRKHLAFGRGPFERNGITTYGHISLRHLIAKNYISQKFADNAFKFCFIRNPYDRAVSLWAYLRLKNYIISSWSFKRFCHRLIERRVPEIGLHNTRGLSHCNPQVRWIKGIGLVTIGRFENLQNDFDSIMDELELPHIQLGHRNKSKHGDYRQYYDTESQQIVRHVYAEDFKAFGYSEEL